MKQKPARLYARELSLRPYPHRLYFAKTAKDFEKAHYQLFKEHYTLSRSQAGRTSGGQGKDDMWTYLIWGNAPHNIAHELAHVILHVFKDCGIDPTEGSGEPFCYLLSSLMEQAGF